MAVMAAGSLLSLRSKAVCIVSLLRNTSCFCHRKPATRRGVNHSVSDPLCSHWMRHESINELTSTVREAHPMKKKSGPITDEFFEPLLCDFILVSLE